VFIGLAPVLSDTGNLEPMNASATTCVPSHACEQRLLLWKEKRTFFFEEKVYSYLPAEGGALGQESKRNKWREARREAPFMPDCDLDTELLLLLATRSCRRDIKGRALG
jgi:hypothetical protein